MSDRCEPWVAISRAAAAPILWGAAAGYTVREIAEGLGVAEGLVVVALETFGPEERRRRPAMARLARERAGARAW